ncbi:MAG: aldo/keto reductase [Planctomycetes bacterium]|nr:aldo/keto reductase [Planctomycetota bacterium]
MTNISRRDFLVRTSLAAGAVALGPRFLAAAEQPKIACGTDLVELGKTGVKTSLLGMGTGTHGVRRSSNQVKLGEAGFVKLIRHGIDRGLTYLDVADQYGSHIYLRSAIREVDRDKIFLQTKTRALTADVARVDIERFRHELGVDVIDSMLMHCMTTATWPTDMRPVMDVLSNAKEKGIVRAVGISCHGWDPLVASTGCDWVDVQLARVNPFGSAMDGKPEDVVGQLRAMRAKGKGVLGMKICGGGRNTTAEQREESLRFVLQSGCVDALVIGMESPQQIDENLALIEKVLQ